MDEIIFKRPIASVFEMTRFCSFFVYQIILNSEYTEEQLITYGFIYLF